MVFLKAISPLRNLASRKAKNVSKKGDISTKTKTARGEHKQRQFNVNAKRGTEQQANSSKQRQSKKHTFQESEEETYPEDALKLMFDYFNKKIEVMQAQTKTWNFLGRNIKNQKTEISFVIQECQHQILRGNIEDVCHSNIDCNAAKKRNKLIKLAN